MMGMIRAHQHPVFFGHQNGASADILGRFAHCLSSLFVVRHKLVLRFRRLFHRETPHRQYVHMQDRQSLVDDFSRQGLVMAHVKFAVAVTLGVVYLKYMSNYSSH